MKGIMNRIFVPTDGDRPEEVIAGAIRASNVLRNAEIHIVGDEGEIRAYAKRKRLDINRIKIENCPETIPMDAKIDWTILKGNSSMVVAARMAKEQNGGLATSGHTGALYIIGTLLIETIPGIERPGLAVPMPNSIGRNTLLLDAGGMVDCKPDSLLGFARLGDAYCKISEEIYQPAIGLLSIGSEPGKGNALTRKASQLIADDKSIDFVGNVEGTDLITGRADAIIADGFAGNVALKVAEGIGEALVQQIIDLYGENDPLVDLFRNRLDPRRHRGAILLGAKNVIVKTHGSGDQIAVCNGIKHVDELMSKQLIASITESLPTGAKEEKS